jgi:hypothetical protein
VAPELIFGAVVAAIALVAIVGKLIPKRKPPSHIFTCSRCRTATRHNHRTEEAWRNGKTKFFCQACHAKWLQSRPPQERESYSRYSPSGGNSGCLGVVVLFALLPLGGWLVWVYA